MKSVLFRYRVSLGLFILGLVVSGITAFPLLWEVSLLHRWLQSVGHGVPGLQRWIDFVNSGLLETYARFPFFPYGTDWLGFGHLVIAMFFVLPMANPVKYRAILVVGLIACAGVLILALVCGPLRGIPFGWRLIDSSFGMIGAIPLLYCLHLTKTLQT
jgi:hypothetical protein